MPEKSETEAAMKYFSWRRVPRALEEMPEKSETEAEMKYFSWR